MADTTYSFRLTGDMLQLTRAADGARGSVSGLATQTDNFAARLAAAQQSIGGFAAQTAALASRIAVPIAAFVAAGAGVKAFATRTAEGIDALNDLADATGSTVPNLSALEDIAARTGTGFDTVGASLTKFNNALKEADGKNGVSQVLKALGLDIAALKAEDPAEALRQVAAALSGYADNGNKARAIQELFGRSVREVAPFLADLAKKTELVGTVTTEQAHAAEVFVHQLADMEKNATDVARAFAGPLIASVNKFFAGIKAYGGLGGFLKDNFRFDQTADIGGNLARTNQEIAGIEKRLQRITGFEQREGLSDAVVKRYAAERAELDAQLVTLKQRSAYILGQAADPTGGPTELARRNRGASLLGDIVKPEKEARARKDSTRDPIEEADRRIQEALERYIEREIALEEKLTEKMREEASKRLQQAQQYGAQLSDQTEVLGASLIADERARGVALIEIDRKRIAEQIAAFQVGVDEQQRLHALLDDNIAARNAQLTEQLKPQWQRMVEGWRDTQRSLKEAADDFQLDFLRTSEDTFVQFVKTGELSIKRIGDLLVEAAAKFVFQQSIGPALIGAGAAFASLFDGTGSAPTGGSGITLGGVSGGSSGGIYSLGTQLATGTNFVPSDNFPAMLHKGEAVIPAKFNPAAGGAGYGADAPINVNVNVIGGQRPDKVESRRGEDGAINIDLLYNQFARRLNEETAAGYGVAGGVQSRFGGSQSVMLGR